MATYKIIGGDQKEYGPVTEESLRKWISEGRANGQTRVRLEEEETWRPLSSFSEFADALRAQAGYSPQPGGAPPINALNWNEQLAAHPASLDIGRCLSRSWILLKTDFPLLFGATFLLWVIGLVGQFIPLVGGLVYWILSGVLYGGLALIYLKRIRGRAAAVSDLFAGFSSGFPQLMLVGLVSSLLSGIGMIFCLLPGIYLFVAWIFSVPLVVDKQLEFWSAMELSRKRVTRVWFQIFGLLVLAFLPYLLIYLFVETKISASAISVVQGFMNAGKPDIERMVQAIMNVARTSLPWVMAIKVAQLLNLPFAVGALIYAYEDLFGARNTPNA